MNVFAKQVSKMLSVIHFIIKTKAAKQMCRCFLWGNAGSSLNIICILMCLYCVSTILGK